MGFGLGSGLGIGIVFGLWLNGTSMRSQLGLCLFVMIAMSGVF